MTRWYADIFKSPEVAETWIPILEENRKKFYGSTVRQTVSSLPLLNFDKLYEENKATGAKLVAVGHDNEGDNVEEMKKVLFQSSDGNLTFIAQCKCGYLKGNYHRNLICPKCHTKVETSFASEINIRAWVELPEVLPPFMHPVVYRVLNAWIGKGKGKADILDTILNINVDLPQDLKDAGIGHGMWYFANPENFWSIVRYFASKHKGQKAQQDQAVLRFLDEYKDCIWMRHIPILNQSLHILTHSGSMTYNDKPSEYILQACLELDEVIKQLRHQTKHNMNYVDQQVYDAYRSWVDYTNSIIKDKIISKSGFIRKNILGTRLHWTGRGVIVPITSRHYADEIELPWRMIVGLYKLEIINRLKLNYGFDINTALKYWHQAQTGILPEMPEGRERTRVEEAIEYVRVCLEQLLEECPFKGFPIIMGKRFSPFVARAA